MTRNDAPRAHGTGLGTPQSPERPCVLWEGSARNYQSRAADELAKVNRDPAHWAWITPTCGTAQCIEPDHLRVHAPVRLDYPYGVCIYCGRSAHTKDHLLPRNWTGDVKRHFVVTVPACGTCNNVLSDALTWSITERRAICHARLRRRFRKVLRTMDHTTEELGQYGPKLRDYVLDELAKKSEVLRMLAWPEDPTYDLRAFERSGIDNPWAIGLLLPDDADVEAIVRAVA